MSETTSEEDRRQSFRLDMEKEMVDIVWTDSNNIERKKKIACLDFSRGGLRVDCDQSIDVQSAVTVVFRSANPNSQKLYGRVLRCIEQSNGWFEIAMRLDDEAH
jgi:hypothetical protein